MSKKAKPTLSAFLEDCSSYQRARLRNDAIKLLFLCYPEKAAGADEDLSLAALEAMNAVCREKVPPLFRALAKSTGKDRAGADLIYEAALEEIAGAGLAVLLGRVQR